MDDYNIKILKKINRLQTEIESGEFAEKAKEPENGVGLMLLLAMR